MHKAPKFCTLWRASLHCFQLMELEANPVLSAHAKAGKDATASLPNIRQMEEITANNPRKTPH